MFTTNYYTAIALSEAPGRRFLNGAIYNSTSASTVGSFFNGSLRNYSTDIAIGKNEVDIIIGHGDTLPTKLDYKLESPIYDNLAFISASVEKIQNNILQKIYHKTIQNIGEENMKIKEIGLLFSASKGGNTYYPILVWREVLEEDITLQPGQQLQLSITLDNYAE